MTSRRKKYYKQFATKLDALLDQYWENAAPNNISLNGPNLISGNNSDFEGGVGDWVGLGTATIVQSSAQAHTGTYSGLVTHTGAGSNTNCVSLPTGFSLTAGKKYSVCFRIRTLSGNRSIAINYGGLTSATYGISASPTWQAISFNIVSTGASTLKIYAAASASFYIDEIVINQVSDIMYNFVFRTSATSGSAQARLVSFYPTGIPFQRIYLATTTGVIVVSLQASPSTSFVLASGTYNDGLWHFGTAIISIGVGSYIYIDGVLKGTSTNRTLLNTTLTNLTNYRIGGDITQADRIFPGDLGEAQLVTFESMPSDIENSILDNALNWKRKGFLKNYPNGNVLFHHDFKKGGLDLSANGNNMAQITNPLIVQL